MVYKMSGFGPKLKSGLKPKTGKYGLVYTRKFICQNTRLDEIYNISYKTGF
jgi:hypothetical protein